MTMATPYENLAGGAARTSDSPLHDPLDTLQDDSLRNSPGTDSHTQSLAHYVEELARGISQLADNLRHQNADEALQQAGSMARDNPALFLLGSLALGFGLSRVLKDQSPEQQPPFDPLPTGATDNTLFPHDPLEPNGQLRDGGEGPQGA